MADDMAHPSPTCAMLPQVIYDRLGSQAKETAL